MTKQLSSFKFLADTSVGGVPNLFKISLFCTGYCNHVRLCFAVLSNSITCESPFIPCRKGEFSPMTWYVTSF